MCCFIFIYYFFSHQLVSFNFRCTFYFLFYLANVLTRIRIPASASLSLCIPPWPCLASVVISPDPDLVIEVEARMNRQYTPPNLQSGNQSGLPTPPVGMSMNNSMTMNYQTRPIPTNSHRKRRTGLATVKEGHPDLDRLGTGISLT